MQFFYESRVEYQRAYTIENGNDFLLLFRFLCDIFAFECRRNGKMNEYNLLDIIF